MSSAQVLTRLTPADPRTHPPTDRPPVPTADFADRSSDDEEDVSPKKKAKRILTKKKVVRKHRRGKKSRMTDPPVQRKVDKGRQRAVKARLAGGEQPDHAPYNTTQFLINDHSDTVQYLDNTLDTMIVRRRSRNSSCSIDSDEEFYYSSPEDEEEFVCREFQKDYNSVRSDRLIAMTKSDLINEYVQMESRIDILEKRLKRLRRREEARHPDVEFDKGEIPMKPEIAEKIRIFQKEIHTLELENDQLRQENESLRSGLSSRSSSSSSSSDSSSSSGSSSSSSESEESEPEEQPEERLREKSPEDRAQDTGYESGHNGQPAAAVPLEQPALDEGATLDDDEEPVDPDLISDNLVSSTSP